VRAVCDGLERWCRVIVVYSMCGVGCVWGEVSAGDIVMFGADTRVCRFTRVRLWDHLEAYGVGGGTTMGRCKGRFSEGGRGGGAMLGGRVCDVVVTPCDVRRLEMARPRIGSLLLLCRG